jgi:hypothetical protein
MLPFSPVKYQVPTNNIMPISDPGRTGYGKTPRCSCSSLLSRLSNLAATIANLPGFEKHAKRDESLLAVK